MLSAQPIEQQQLYRSSLALLTDFYQLSMAYGYWKQGLQTKEAVFHLFFRRMPFRGGFAITAGLEAVIQHITNMRFEPSDIHYLSSLKNAEGEPFFRERSCNT